MTFRLDRVYTLADLPTWSSDHPTLAVLGDPVAHSLSPPMHRAALDDLVAKDATLADWDYVRFAIPADDLLEALPRFHAAGFSGLNLTIPHKVIALPACVAVTDEARAMGAVNTLHAQSEGWHGSNTDGFGIEAAIRETLHRELAGSDVWLIGAGGAARAVAMQCLLRGVRRLWIANRGRERLDDLRERLQPHVGQAELCGFTLDTAPWGDLVQPLVINVSAAGLKPGDPAPLPVEKLAEGAAIYDSTYGQVNALARTAETHRMPYADGLSMLVWQGWKSLQTWTGQDPDATVMARVAQAALQG